MRTWVGISLIVLGAVLVLAGLGLAFTIYGIVVLLVSLVPIAGGTWLLATRPASDSS